MNNFLIATFSNFSKSQKIEGTPNKRIKLVKAFSMDDTDFMLSPSLALRIEYGNNQIPISRSLATFIDPYQANTRVVEFQNYVFPAGVGIKMEIYNKESSVNKPFEIGIAYELI